MKQIVVPLVLCALMPFSFATSDADVKSIAAQFRELARLDELTKGLPTFDKANTREKELMRQENDALRALTHQPIERVLVGIDQALHGTDRQEIAGALSAYNGLIGLHRTTPDPRFKPLLLRMLAEDEFGSSGYTEAVSGALLLYRSRETMLAWMDGAKRAPDEKTHDEFVMATAALLDIQFDYTLGDPPEKKRQAIAQFESWFEKNKDHIRFDKEGNAHFGKGPGQWKAPELTSADRARIKEDPECVLRLFERLQGEGDPDSKQLQEMNQKCGPALLGADGSEALDKAMEQSQSGSQPSIGDQFSLSSAMLSYPAKSALLTAIAYVASDERSSEETRRLAKKLLDDFGADLDEALKGEPVSIQKKVHDLMNEDPS